MKNILNLKEVLSSVGVEKSFSQLTHSDGIIIEDFESLTGWTVGAGSAELDSVHVKHGTNGIKLTSTNNVTAYMTKTISINFSDKEYITLWFYVWDQSSYTTSTLLYISSTTNLSANMGYSVPSGFVKVFQNGWNKLVLTKSMFTASGGESWSNLMIRIRVRVASPVGGSSSVTFDSLSYGEYKKPQIVISFDDGRKTDYTEAYNYMKSKGLKGTCFVPMANVGADGTYMTLADLTELYGVGWDIGNHSYNHTDLTTLSIVDAETELQDEIDALNSAGFTRASKMLAWPFSAVDDDAITACNNVGILCGRTGINYLQPTISDLQLTLRRVSVSNTMSIGDLTAKIDEAISRGVTAIYNFHRILDPATESTEVLPATFQGFIDYVASKRDLGLIDVVTISEWYNKVNRI